MYESLGGGLDFDGPPGRNQNSERSAIRRQ